MGGVKIACRLEDVSDESGERDVGTLRLSALEEGEKGFLEDDSDSSLKRGLRDRLFSFDDRRLEPGLLRRVLSAAIDWRRRSVLIRLIVDDR